MREDFDRIEKWIEEKMPDILEDLKRICRIRSVAEVKGTDYPPYGKGCAAVLEEMLLIGEENGFETHNYENYVGRITYPGREKTRTGIWAHLDVVDEGDAADWDYPPYEPTIRDGYFIGRGCQDNKSSAVIGLYTLKYMKEHGIVLRNTLELYLGTCEEEGMPELDYFLEHYEAPEISLVPDSGFPVCCGERGSFNGELVCDEVCDGEILGVDCHCGLYTVPDHVDLRLRYSQALEEKLTELPADIQVETDRERGVITVTARGVSTQAANPAKGKCALTALAAFCCEREISGGTERGVFALIQDLNRDHSGAALNIDREDALSGGTVLTATRLKLEKGHLTIEFISKYPVTENDFPYEQSAGEAAKKRGFTLHTTRLSRANYFDPERREVRILTRVSNEVLGREDKPFVMSGGTYARKLPNSFAFGTGMPLKSAPQGLFRPGHGNYHQPDESISLERLRKGLEIYIRGILELDKED